MRPSLPTVFSRAPVAALALAAIALAAATEEGASPGPSAMDDEALLARARVLIAEEAGAEKALEAEKGALAAGKTILEERRAQVAALRIPEETPLPAPAGVSAAEGAKARQQHAAERVAALRQRLRLLEAEKTALEERTRRLEEALARAAALDARASALAPIAAEVERRVASGTIAASSVPESLIASRLSERLVQLAELRRTWQNEAAGVRAALRAMPAHLDQANAAIAEAEARQAAAAREAIELQRREAVEREFAEKEPGALAALLSSLAGERDRLAQSFERASSDLEAARAAEAEAAGALGAAIPPNPDEIALEESTPRVRAAEKALKLATAVATYQTRRSAHLESQLAAVTRLSERAAALSKEATAFDEHLLHLEVLVNLITRLRAEGKLPAAPLPREVEPESLARARLCVANALSASTAEAQAAKARAAAVSRQIEEAKAAQKTETDRLTALKAAFESAKENARFTREVEKLKLPELLTRFEEARAGWRTAEAAIAAARAKLEATEAAIREVESRLRTLEDPLARRARQQNPEEGRRIREALYRAAGREPPPLAESAPGAGKAPGTARIEPAAAPPPSPAAPGAPVEPDEGRAAHGTEAIIASIQARQNTNASRVRVFDEQIKERAVFADALKRRSACLEELRRACAAAIEQAQRALGAALELETRVGQKELASESLPEGVSEALKRDRLATLENELVAIEKRQVELNDQIVAVEKRTAEVKAKRDLLAEALTITGRKLDALRERAQLESRFERPLGALSEIERKRHDQEVRRRLERDDSIGELILRLFHSTRAEELTELLVGYYGELLELERKAANVEARKKVDQRLLRLAAEGRKSVETLLPLARFELARYRALEAEAQIRTGIARAGDKKILELIEQAGRKAPSPEPVPPEKMDEVAEALFDAHVRVAGAEMWVGELEQRLTRAGIDAEVGIYQDDLGALEASTESLRLEVERLTGRPRADLERLEPAERPASPTEEVRFLGGEIGYTRQLREQTLVRAALFSILNLIVIPIVALYLVRAARFVGARIVKRVREEGDEEGASEREQRASTLVHVFKAAWTTVVCVVAAIYMLKQLRFDVTPIIASAGVVGLAIAFGAQTLIRDFFAGFFMLLENQYKIGDIVKIGEIGGVVERITLRLTVLRDLQGTVHFIPNGTVARVSNMTKGWSRAVLEIGVAYKEDVDRVMAVLREVGEKMYRDAAFGPKLIEPPEIPGVEAFGDSAVTVRMMFKTRPAEQWAVAREARRRIKRAFDEQNIEIPFPQRVVYHVHPEQPPRSPEGSGRVAPGADATVD